MTLLSQTLDNIHLGAPQQHHNLTLFPLAGFPEHEPDYITLNEALEARTAWVREISDSGSVPEILFENNGEKPVLLLDGEELVGAKQNRILNLTILAPAMRHIAIPVSCVEAGRWARNRADFHTTNRVMYSKVRMQKARAVSASLRYSNARRADQTEVWDSIAETAQAFGTDSRTGAMGDIFEQRQQSLDKYLAAFTASDRDIGALFLVNGKVAGFDLFDHPSTHARIFPKLLRSHALDAILDSGKSANADATTPASSKDAAQRFLQQTQTCSTEHYPAIGEGQDLRLDHATLVGGGLEAYQRLIHLCVFANDDSNPDRHRSRSSSAAADRPLWRRRGPWRRAA